MKITFDVVPRGLSFDPSGADVWGCDLVAAIARYGQRLDIRGLTMGVTVTVDGLEALAKSWPAAGTKFSATDQDILASERLQWEPGAVISIDVWIDLAGERHEASYNLTSPDVTRPYPSWTWNGAEWVAPVAYPDDGEYTWNETNQEWQVV